MKVFQSARRHRLTLALGALALVSMLLLAILLRGLVQSYLAIPAAQALQWLRLQYLRIPQSGIWMVFLIVACLLFLVSILQHSDRRSGLSEGALLALEQPSKRHSWGWEDPALFMEQPLKRLTQLIEHKGSDSAHHLCQIVSELAVTVLAERTGQSRHQVKAEILQRRLELPEDVASYIRDGLKLGEHTQPRWTRGSNPRSRVDERLYKTLQFLENEDWKEQIDEN